MVFDRLFLSCASSLYTVTMRAIIHEQSKRGIVELCASNCVVLTNYRVLYTGFEVIKRRVIITDVICSEYLSRHLAQNIGTRLADFHVSFFAVCPYLKSTRPISNFVPAIARTT